MIPPTEKTLASSWGYFSFQKKLEHLEERKQSVLDRRANFERRVQERLEEFQKEIFDIDEERKVAEEEEQLRQQKMIDILVKRLEQAGQVLPVFPLEGVSIEDTYKQILSLYIERFPSARSKTKWEEEMLPTSSPSTDILATPESIRRLLP